MPHDTTPADQFARRNRLLVALARDVQESEGRMLHFETAEQMQRTIRAARTELDALALELGADEKPAR